ncbi:MAG: type II toxin-antitoxin system VapC family toxin [Planctomycetota bacterium]
MHYLDTSVLTSYYCDEERTERVQKVLSDIEAPTISPLVEVEFCCSVARKERAGAVERPEALRILSEFRLHLAEPRYAVVPIRTTEFNLAAEWIARLTSPLGVH